MDWRGAFRAWNDLNQRITDDSSIILEDAVQEEVASVIVNLDRSADAIKALPNAPASLKELQEQGEKLATHTQGLATFYLLALTGDQASTELVLSSLENMSTALTNIMEILKANGR